MSETTADDVARLLAGARAVVVVPGYGVALAQAQVLLKALADELIGRGVDVVFAVHPVAGRLPGHLASLLNEVGVPYASLLGVEAAAGRLAAADVALVVGASDVVNPLARRPGSALSGMKVLDVARAGRVVVLNRPGPGFVGVENPLLADEATAVLPGDARDTLGAVLAALKQ